MVQISARIPTEMATGLELLAKHADRSLSAELRRAIRLYIAQVKAAASRDQTPTPNGDGPNPAG